jgi:hypothetical protein
MEDVYNEVHSENLIQSDEIKTFKNEIADLNDECQSYKQVNMDLTRENQKLFASLQTERQRVESLDKQKDIGQKKLDE